ncbi:thiol-disulfide isomerase/thioredoxin [Elusimicrobium simillimum]|uniref:TlpA disulfide reductase family protein n=1 Tax=Elusimicrobium simillimum TaxID=3143438 RepID=UPI003C703660
MKKYLIALTALTLLMSACSFSGPKVAFNLPSIDGTQFDSETVAKGKPVFLMFMSTSCGYCKASIPQIITLQNEFGPKGVAILGVFADPVPGGPAAYQKEMGINFNVIYNGAELAQECHVNGVPHFVLLNKKHQLVKIWSGYNPQHPFAEEINKVL